MVASTQFLAQALRQVMGLPQTAHGLLGRDDLLPLNAVLIAAFLRWMAISTVLGYDSRLFWQVHFYVNGYRNLLQILLI